MPKRKKDATDASDDETRTTNHSTIVMALGTAIDNAGRVLHLDRDDQGIIHDEMRRCVAAQSRITVLASWFLNYYLAWLSDDQILDGHADINHAFFAARPPSQTTSADRPGMNSPSCKSASRSSSPLSPFTSGPS
jgi:hypothetical protein